MKIFLQLNRWFYLIPFALYFIPFSPFRVTLAIIGSILMLFWLYAVSFYGQKQLIKENLPISNFQVFKVFLIALPVLIMLNLMLGSWFLDKNNSIGFVLFFVFVLATIFSAFYLYYFAAKTITTIEKKRKVTLNECYNSFVLIGLSGLGVFFLQPKIQKLIDIDNTNQPKPQNH